MNLTKTLALALALSVAGTMVTEAWAAKKTAKPAPEPAAAEPAPAPAAGPPQQSQIDSQKDWNAYKYLDKDGSVVCYANSKPRKSEAVPPIAAGKRDPAYFFITNRPAKNVRDEISIAIGYPFKPHSDVGLQIGNDSFTLFSDNDFAWVRNAADQPRIIAAMKGGKTLVVKGVSKRGTNTTDTYSLAGLNAVLKTIDTKCK